MSPRRLFAMATVLAGLVGATGAHSQTNALPPAADMPPSAPRRPSIILIVAEGLGWGDLGCYGQTKIQTPHLDELAKQGVRFTDFHAAGAELQSRAALFSGRSTHDGLETGASTLAENLKASGYRTGLMGYWGLANFGSRSAAHRRGVEYFAGYANQAHSRQLYAGGLNRFDPDDHFEGRVPLLENSDGRTGLFVPELLTTAAINFCKRNKPQLLNKYRPFLLVVSYPLPAAVEEGYGPAPGDAAYVGQSWPDIQKRKAATITQLDHYVGQILDEVERAKIADNTIIVFTSTGGPAAKSECNPGFFKSAGPYALTEDGLAEGNLRVPLIVRWPFWIKSPKTVDLLSVNSDLVPTLLEMARVEPPSRLEGISFLPTLMNETQTNRHDSLVWRSTGEDNGSAVRQGEWRAVRRGTNNAVELFNLGQDPGEKRNVATNNPSVMARLRKLLGPESQREKSRDHPLMPR